MPAGPIVCQELERPADDLVLLVVILSQARQLDEQHFRADHQIDEPVGRKRSNLNSRCDPARWPRKVVQGSYVSRRRRREQAAVLGDRLAESTP
ncbi:hypothetical protein ACPXCJ_24525 [Micromonospora chalcea]|uniref:hypothetical protein n=1 Tax=Micromonospora chalcea TaxID=1874 RepID=UPI003CFB83DD